MTSEVHVTRRGDSANYHAGAGYALITSALLAVQEPFSALAARKLSAADFIAVTQISLLLSIPLLIQRGDARRDFLSLLGNWRMWPKFAVLLGIGLAGLGLYDVGLGGNHPIIAAAVLNLSPFWAAMVARVVSHKRLPASAGLFFGCFIVAFLGAMVVARSQINVSSGELWQQVVHNVLHSHWIFALPMPILFALSGTLVYIWFPAVDEGAAVGANFVVSALVLIPAAVIFHVGGGATPTVEMAPAVALLLVGTLASSAAGRVAYQAALSATHNDNGFVTMFFLLIPALSTLVSWPLSPWIRELVVRPTPQFFAGLALVTAPLFLFAWVALKDKPRPGGKPR